MKYANHEQWKTSKHAIKICKTQSVHLWCHYSVNKDACSRIDIQTHARRLGLGFDLWPFHLRVIACRGPAMYYMSTDFAADISSRFCFSERTNKQTNRQTDRRDWTPYRTPAAIQPAWINTHECCTKISATNKQPKQIRGYLFITARRCASAVHAVIVILSICPSVCHKADIVPKWLKIGYCKQCHSIDQGVDYSFLMPKIFAKFQRNHPNGGAK